MHTVCAQAVATQHAAFASSAVSCILRCDCREASIEDRYKEDTNSRGTTTTGPTPAVPWFGFELLGPGMPESIEGQFIWLSSPRYLIIQPWISDIFASFLIQPDRSDITLRFLFAMPFASGRAATNTTTALFEPDAVRMLQDFVAHPCMLLC